MSDTGPQSSSRLLDPAEALHGVANFCATAVSYAGVDSLLHTHTGYLKAWEQMAADWLNRRHQATADTQKLLERLQDSRDIHEFLSAQHDWYSATLQRLVVDCASWMPLTIAVMAKGATGATDEPARPDASAARSENSTRPPGAASAGLRSASASTLIPARTSRVGGASHGEAGMPKHSA
jgi:hypothetical protein